MCGVKAIVSVSTFSRIWDVWPCEYGRSMSCFSVAMMYSYPVCFCDC